MKKKYYDILGIELKPYNPQECKGNGKHKNIECCCDGCAFQIGCLLLDKDTDEETKQSLYNLGYSIENINTNDWRGNKKPFRKYNLFREWRKARRQWKEKN